MDRITLLLVDDQDIILDGLQALLELDERFSIVGRASDARTAIDLATSLRPDVVIMDINMPGMDGIEASREMMKRNRKQKVLILSMYDNRDFVAELLDVGVRGYILKNTGRKELCDAIVAVAGGRRHLAEPLQAMLEERPQSRWSQGVEHSTPTRREKEIIRMILGERTTQQIADALALSCSTVETHRKNILNKLGVHNSTGLARYALERGWQAT